MAKFIGHIRKTATLALFSILFQPFVSELQAQQPAIIPVMKIQNPERATEKAVELRNLKVDIRVTGNIAVTTLDMIYFNPNSRVMEGEFSFPLGEGQAISRFALDVNGTLREGVVVEKEKARKTFEAVERRGVDPGLLEMTEGNNFRMRVYPLPPKGTRRVVIAFEQELTDKGSYDLYLLPLKIDEALEKFSIHAEVIKNVVSLDAENNELTNFRFSKWNDSYVADMAMDDYSPDKQLALSFPHKGDAEQVFTAYSDKSRDSSYFYINVRPEARSQNKTLPGTISILWDNSGSAVGRDTRKELALLGSYINKLGNVTVELVPFNISAEKAEIFTITGGNWDKLREAISSMVYDGGTSFGSLNLRNFRSDEILIFSDGISDFGGSEPVYSGTTVYTINSGIQANHEFLSYLAQRSGGAYINLNSSSSAEALVLLSGSNYHFISAKVENGQVSDIFPSQACQFTNTFSLSGLMAGSSATLVLNFGFGNNVVYSKKITVQADNSGSMPTLRRLWAEKKIAELSRNAAKNKEEITRTGKEFGIVTQNTSLLVLETIDDYVRYKIVPPEELRAEYFSRTYDNAREVSRKCKDHLNRIVSLMDLQSNWWKTDFRAIRAVEDKHKYNLYSPQMVDSVTSETSGLQEVVVVGYGTRRSNRVSGAVAGVRVSNASVLREEEDAATPFVMAEERMQTEKSGKEMKKADISINAWDPQTPYLKVLQYARKGDEYSAYLKLKTEYGSTPAFYIDASDFFSKSGNTRMAVKIISNLAELQLESPQLQRILGYKLSEYGCVGDAMLVFKKVLENRGEEPQSYRDLGLAYKALGNNQMAISTLYEIVKKEWDGRFPGIEVVVMNEINNLLSLHPELDHSFIDGRLIRKEPVDIRVVLRWDTDNSDMDLWVTDPSGEKCFYSHKLTRAGGKISDDFTGGYGPEEFMIRNADHGVYKVQADYFGTNSQTILAPVNLHLTFFSNYGKPDQKEKEVTVRLDTKKDVVEIGSFSF
jgi:hypothetical protein